MQYIEAIDRSQEIKYPESLFLAGGITGCHDWQQEVVKAMEDFNITLINPRRKVFDINNPDDSVQQIPWEHEYLRKSKSILFWFPEETLCPITLFELGGALERKQNLFVGCHPNYKRSFDVEIQCHLQNHSHIFHSLHDLIDIIQINYNMWGYTKPLTECKE